jgi:tetratricopeptide (TPR) repeat protein
MGFARTAPALALACALTCGCHSARDEAAALVREGDGAASTDEVISKYEQAVVLDPTNDRILWKLALAYHEKEDWSKVASTCERAERVAPTFASYFFEHGYALEMQATKGPTSWTEAEEPLREAIALDPNLARAHEELAEVQTHLARNQEALQHYARAIELNPDELAYYPPLADLLFRLEHAGEAQQVLREAIARSSGCGPSGFAIHALLGSILERNGDLADAEREFEAAKKCEPRLREPEPVGPGWPGGRVPT